MWYTFPTSYRDRFSLRLVWIFFLMLHVDIFKIDNYLLPVKEFLVPFILEWIKWRWKACNVNILELMRILSFKYLTLFLRRFPWKAVFMETLFVWFNRIFRKHVIWLKIGGYAFKYPFTSWIYFNNILNDQCHIWIY